MKLGYDYNLAKLIATFVGLSMGGKDIPVIEDIYPDLFGAGTVSEEQQQEYQLMMFTALAQSINKERGRNK